jgi:hypothetical protein
MTKSVRPRLFQSQLSNSQVSFRWSHARTANRSPLRLGMLRRPRCGKPREFQILFSISLPGGSLSPQRAEPVFTPKRGSRAPQSAESPCPCKEHGTDPAGPASPYGAPLRRFQSLGPRLPLVRKPFGFREGARNEPWASILRREAGPRTPGAAVSENRGRRRRSPSTLSFARPNAPLWMRMRSVYIHSETMSITKLY